MDNVFDKEFIVWTKFCIPCVDSEGWKTFEDYCKHRGITITVNRTTYIKDLHDKATAIWGGEDYTMFVQYHRAILNFSYAVKEILDGKELFEQPIPSTKPLIKKNKPAKRGKNK